jgi:adenosylmethionine-8-amino-7-oxononanoate aminotransferase
LSVGLACSECFSGARLGKLLKPGFDYEQKVMEDLLAGNSAAPLSLHTSGGVSEAFSGFIDALEPHLPWKGANELDWCVSLQLEGASAVWAAIDMVLQEAILTTGNKKRKLVAVGATSYHGPPSTSFGAKCPLWQKSYQVKYPVPIAGMKFIETEYMARFEAFLEKHAHEVGVILFEPQWGSSQAAMPWPQNILKKCIANSKARGIGVVCDEIMCGLGRHGQGSLFASTDLDLDPDAITFGKAIGGGVYPISGAILKKGREKLCEAGCSVMQSHTYAGASVRALMTATEVLREVPNWLPSIQKLGEEMAYIFGYLAKISDGMLITHGQGLMWGGLFTKEGEMGEAGYRSQAMKCFRRHCDEVGVLPYIVPAGGFMVTPMMDVDVGTLYEIGEKLEQVILRTMQEIGWKDIRGETKQELFDIPELVIEDFKCQTYLHQTKSCTSCSDFVCQDVRSRFVKSK